MSEQSNARSITFTAEMIPRILDGSKTQSRRVVRAKHKNDNGIITGPAADPGGAIEAWGGGARHKASHMCVIKSRYGPVGQRLYVQESFRVNQCDVDGDGFTSFVKVEYKVDGVITATRRIPLSHWDKPTSKPGKWHSGRFMPQWASRIMLERTGCRVERVQDISADDAKAEGILPNCGGAQFIDGRWQVPTEDVCPAGNCDECLNEWLTYPFVDANEDAPAYSAKESFQSLWDSINLKSGHGWDANEWVDVVEFKVIEKVENTRHGE